MNYLSPWFLACVITLLDLNSILCVVIMIGRFCLYSNNKVKRASLVHWNHDIDGDKWLKEGRTCLQWALCSLYRLNRCFAWDTLTSLTSHSFCSRLRIKFDKKINLSLRTWTIVVSAILHLPHFLTLVATDCCSWPLFLAVAAGRPLCPLCDLALN